MRRRVGYAPCRKAAKRSSLRSPDGGNSRFMIAPATPVSISSLPNLPVSKRCANCWRKVEWKAGTPSEWHRGIGLCDLSRARYIEQGTPWGRVARAMGNCVGKYVLEFGEVGELGSHLIEMRLRNVSYLAAGSAARLSKS